ncbi:hypothetical protein Pelo_2311 [Pelomyxa schiedti]|nr:hypothetical protein Pelo_2311 [Pelomyxa schiedti]
MDAAVKSAFECVLDLDVMRNDLLGLDLFVFPRALEGNEIVGVYTGTVEKPGQRHVISKLGHIVQNLSQTAPPLLTTTPAATTVKIPPQHEPNAVRRNHDHSHNHHQHHEAKRHTPPSRPLPPIPTTGTPSPASSAAPSPSPKAPSSVNVNATVTTPAPAAVSSDCTIGTVDSGRRTSRSRSSHSKNFEPQRSLYAKDPELSQENIGELVLGCLVFPVHHQLPAPINELVTYVRTCLKFPLDGINLPSPIDSSRTCQQPQSQDDPPSNGTPLARHSPHQSTDGHAHSTHHHHSKHRHQARDDQVVATGEKGNGEFVRKLPLSATPEGILDDLCNQICELPFHPVYTPHCFMNSDQYSDWMAREQSSIEFQIKSLTKQFPTKSSPKIPKFPRGSVPNYHHAYTQILSRMRMDQSYEVHPFGNWILFEFGERFGVRVFYRELMDLLALGKMFNYSQGFLSQLHNQMARVLELIKDTNCIAYCEMELLFEVSQVLHIQLKAFVNYSLFYQHTMDCSVKAALQTFSIMFELESALFPCDLGRPTPYEVRKLVAAYIVEFTSNQFFKLRDLCFPAPEKSDVTSPSASVRTSQVASEASISIAACHPNTTTCEGVLPTSISRNPPNVVHTSKLAPSATPCDQFSALCDLLVCEFGRAQNVADSFKQFNLDVVKVVGSSLFRCLWEEVQDKLAVVTDQGSFKSLLLLCTKIIHMTEQLQVTSVNSNINDVIEETVTSSIGDSGKTSTSKSEADNVRICKSICNSTLPPVRETIIALFTPFFGKWVSTTCQSMDTWFSRVVASEKWEISPESKVSHSLVDIFELCGQVLEVFKCDNDVLFAGPTSMFEQVAKAVAFVIGKYSACLFDSFGEGLPKKNFARIMCAASKELQMTSHGNPTSTAKPLQGKKHHKIKIRTEVLQGAMMKIVGKKPPQESRILLTRQSCVKLNNLDGCAKQLHILACDFGERGMEIFEAVYKSLTHTRLVLITFYALWICREEYKEIEKVIHQKPKKPRTLDDALSFLDEQLTVLSDALEPHIFTQVLHILWDSLTLEMRHLVSSRDEVASKHPASHKTWLCKHPQYYKLIGAVLLELRTYFWAEGHGLPESLLDNSSCAYIRGLLLQL